MPLPAWLASRMQVPAAVKVTTPAEMVQPVLEASTVMVTGQARRRSPSGCRWRRRRSALAGAVEVKVMVWVPLPTVKDCWTWGAACSWRCRPGWRR